MSKFKKGDWIISRLYGDEPQQFYEEDEYSVGELYAENNKYIGSEDRCKLWEPKEGEWCWLKTDKDFKLVKYDIPTFNQAVYHGKNPIIEPFIGKLPTFLH